MKNFIYISLGVLLSTYLTAQEADPIHFLGFYTNGEVRLRWAIEDQKLWEYGNQVGYTIKRITLEENGVPLDDQAKRDSRVTIASGYRPMSETEIDNLYPDNVFAQAGKNLLYNDTTTNQSIDPAEVTLAAAIESANNKDAQFLFTQMQADMDFETAHAMGLGYTDNTVVDHMVYSYRITYTEEPPSNLVTHDYNDLESGLGDWIDGGTHCVHRDWGAPFASSGEYAILLRNGNTTSNTTIEGLDFSDYAKVRIAYNARSVGAEVGEGFSIQVSIDGGPFETRAEYVLGTNLDNNANFRDTLVLYQTGRMDDIAIRFQMNGNQNNDRVYLDDLHIEGFSSNLFKVVNIDTDVPYALTELEITKAVGQDSTVQLEWDISGDAGLYSYYDIERAAVSSGPSCSSIANITAASASLPNSRWNNQINVGGTALSSDGELCFTIDDIVPFQRAMIGLNGDPHTNAHYNKIDFSMYLWEHPTLNNRIYIFESGANKGIKINQANSFKGSTFCVKRTGTTIEYLMDGSVFYTSTATSTGDLFFDNSFFRYASSSISLTDIEICPASSGNNGPLTWEKVNELPYVYAESEGINSDIVMYLDSIPDNETTYAYRVCGKTPYGILSPPSDTVHVKGMPGRLDLVLKIDTTIYQPGPDNLMLEWEALDPADESKMTGYDIHRSKYFDGPFEKINSSTISASNYTYNDIDPFPAAYYKVVGLDENAHRYESLVKYVQLPDSIPPAIPTITSVEFISDTEVQVKWNHVLDEDLSGYRVFYANGQMGNYMQLNDRPVKVDHYTFSIDPNTEVDSIYVKLCSEDLRQNNSDKSVEVGVDRPDIYGPSAPVLSKVAPEPAGIQIYWVWSTTDDVTRHVLQRRATASPTWVDLVTVLPQEQDSFPSGALEVSYVDSTYTTVEDYQYRFIAYDDNYNLTSSKIFNTRPYQSQVSGNITNVNVDLDATTNFTDPDVAAAIAALREAGVQNSLTAVTRNDLSQDYDLSVSWTYPLDPNLKEFKIYRSVTGGDMQIYKTVSLASAMGYEDSEVAVSAPVGNTNFNFTDKDLAKNKRYAYEIKAVHKDGSVSNRSSQVSKLVE